MGTETGLTLEERRDELRNVAAGVLVVAVGVDDDVGAELDAGVDPGRECRGQALPSSYPAT